MIRTKRIVLPAVLFLCALSGKEFAAAQMSQQSARQLVDRQARAWERNDFTMAAADWLPTATFYSPDGILSMNQIPVFMKDYVKNFGDLQITVNNVFVSADGKKLAVEWNWAVTRKRDGRRGASRDAIIVDLDGGKIASWRDYYDPARKGEAYP